MESKGFDRENSFLRGIVVFFIFFAMAVNYGFAEEAATLYLENDSRRFKPNHATDRHYTHGTKFVYLTQPDWQWLEDFSRWGFSDGVQPVDTAVGFFLGQHIYTPDHASEPEKRNPEDMVFAGWLYTGMFAQRATDDVLDHLELSMGVIGPSSKAEQVQLCIHNLLDSGDPIGWDGQMEDELAVDLTFMRQQRLLSGWFKPSSSTDFIAEYGFTAGSVHRHLQAGLTVRCGFNLERTFGPDRLVLPSGVSTLRKDKDGKSGYFFARATGRAVEHNRFLTGLDVEPLVGEFQVGLVYQHKKFEFGYAQTFFTREFEEQSGKDSIGAFTFSLKF